MLGYGLSSLRGRIILLVLFTASIPFTAAVIHGLGDRQVDGQIAREMALTTVRHAAAAEVAFINGAQHLLSVLARIPALNGESISDCRDQLTALLQPGTPFLNYAIIQADGEVTCSAMEMTRPVNVADRSYFQRAMVSHSFAVGDFQIGRIVGSPGLGVTLPILDAQGEVKALVYGFLSLAWMKDVLANAELPPDSTLTLLDSQYTILTRYPERPGWVGRRVADSPLLKAIATSDGNSGTVDAMGLDGVPRLFAYTRLVHLPGTTDIYVTIGIPEAAAYAEADASLRAHLLFLSAAMSLGLLAAWLSGERLVLRPTRRLVAAAQRLAAGDLTTRVGSGGEKSEYGQIARAFDQMVDGLESRDREARAHLQRSERLNRMYSVVSAINGTILRIREPELLLQEACRIAVEKGGFRLVWAGLLESETGDILPVAHAGNPGDFLGGLSAPLKPDSQESTCLCTRALRNGKPTLCNDIENDPCNPHWGEQLTGMGLHSAVAFPLVSEGQIVGVFCLYSPQPHYFDKEELRLLTEVAADVGLGLEYCGKDDRLHHLAYFNPLTGLPNQSLFEDRLGQLTARASHTDRHTGVVMLNILGFRRITDTFGRHAGDKLLQEMAGYLRYAVRSGDTVAYLGGDRFGIILADLARPDDARLVVNQLLAACPKMVIVGEDEILLKISAGVAIHPADGNEPTGLLQAAQLALRSESIIEGGTVGFYAPEIDAKMQEFRRIEQALNHAIERQELALHYQPVVEMASRRVIGFEALARWNNPELGAVSPASFIPVAEETGFILSLGEWAIETACRQLITWQEHGLLTPRTAINVSVKQLLDVNFLQRVEAILDAVGVNPDAIALALEITESTLMHKVSESAVVLRKLKSLGFQIYIDDFGTGYSSLAYLHKLPVDVLKIDRAFIQDIATNTESVSIARSIIALAKSLGISTIAEGIETEEQLSIIAELGCGSFQGYLFSPAVDADRAAEWMATNRTPNQ